MLADQRENAGMKFSAKGQPEKAATVKKENQKNE